MDVGDTGANYVETELRCSYCGTKYWPSDHLTHCRSCGAPL